MTSSSQKNIYIGMGLAVLATLIWSGNFIAARGVIKQIQPGQLAFYRWLVALIIIFPFAIKKFVSEWKLVKQSWQYILWVSLTGVALFNTFVYIGAHYTTAINLALIGTTTSPIFAIILARIFLKEKISVLKMAGMFLCIAGVVILLSGMNVNSSFSFTAGDAWILAAAFSFAVYNTLVRKKPAGISTVNFLFVIFTAGTLLLFPFYLWEVFYSHPEPVQWTRSLLLIILFLGLGASVICFLCWNIAIGKLGAGRTALFGNLIPVFSSIEASIILGEKFTRIHLVSMLLVSAGIVLANWRRQNKEHG